MFRKDILAGKRVLVTGGGTGLGKSMSRRFLELGAALSICGRREAVLKETAEELASQTGAPVRTFSCDIRSVDAVEEMIGQIWLEGPLDVLVNNAAGNFLSRTEDLSPRAFQAVIGIVLMGTIHATMACGRRWLRANRPATVLSISATYAETGSAYVVPSAIAKAGVVAMTRSLAVEWGDRGIRFNAIAPGAIPTQGAFSRLVPSAEVEQRILDHNPLHRFGTHEELANLAAFLVSDGAAYMNGEVVRMDGGELLQGAGEFSSLGRLMTEEMWQAMKPRKS